VEERILAKLQSLPDAVTASDVAREMVANPSAEQLERVRQAARRLVASGVIEIVQGARVIDPSTARGEIWLRLR